MNNYKKRAFTYATIVAMGGFIFGLDAAIMSGTVSFITKEFNLDAITLGFAVSAPSLGVVIALPFAGYISNTLGRKKALQIVAFLYVISAIGSALAPTFWILVMARFLGGLAFSSISLASMYIGEIAPPKWRGKLVSMTQINIVIGLSAAYFINYLILQWVNSDSAFMASLGVEQNIWRWMLGAEVAPAFLWWVLLSAIPRSPVWLLYKDRLKEAKTVLSLIYTNSEVEIKIQNMLESVKNSSGSNNVMQQLKAIFGKRMRVTLIIAMTIAIVQQSTGINAILFFAPTVIEQIGIGKDASFMQAIWIGVTSVLFTVLSIMLIDRIGRKPMMIWGLVWIIVSLTVCAYGFFTAQYTITPQIAQELAVMDGLNKIAELQGEIFSSDIAFKAALQKTIGEVATQNHWSLLLQKAAQMNSMLILFGILSFIAAFHFSVGPIMWVLFSEIFPNTVRGIAIPFFTIISSITNYLVQQFFPWQLETFGGGYVFIFYASTVLIGMVILVKYLVETKNMTIEAIQEKLSGKELINI